MKVEKLGMSIEEMTETEYAKAQAAKARAVQDYNIMMGNLDDPEEDEEDEEDE